MPHEISPKKSSSEATALVVLRIQGRVSLEETLDHRVVAEEGCEVQRCFALGAAAKLHAEPNETKGRKLWENFEKIWAWHFMLEAEHGRTSSEDKKLWF